MQRSCHCSEDGKCSKLRVRKVGEGRYNIAGRNVFIRVSLKFCNHFALLTLIFYLFFLVAERKTYDGACRWRLGYVGTFLITS